MKCHGRNKDQETNQDKQKSLAHLPSSFSALFLFPVLELMSKDNKTPKFLHEAFIYSLWQAQI